MRLRGFEQVSKKSIEKSVQDNYGKDYVILTLGDGVMPVRSTATSAGYDFATPVEVTIPKGKTRIIYTNIKAYMPEGEWLFINIRSSIGIKKHLRIANIIGTIDADYYNNEDNEGNIIIALYNYGNEDITLKAEERIAQGIFLPFGVADSETEEVQPKKTRKGGVGSTN